ncbi:hypothetical protein LTR37_019517 [Vermiconidia calcicola]|uniref:Uncharacterized protein n=1 Tax=Vermiconidia calcicola TaxID=1690605 RepID=A0ACC3MFP6_9PEZI|nr:hypothetical protein LTR37_019517 [Vermiconidia calcicola]
MADKGGGKSQAEQEKEKQRKQETSQAAKKSIELQKQAKELKQAAAGAGDPDERQKLLNEALNKEVEAESFGKTARYLQSGTFQGLCAGTGLGGGIGVGLGTITGTLVGGTTGTVTGGLGGAVGAGVGYLHGAWFKVGDLAGNTLRKVTGDLPGWKSTEEQKQALEKMVNGVKEQDPPSEEELKSMSEEGGKVPSGKGYTGQRPEDEKQKGLMQGVTPSMSEMSVSGMSAMGLGKKKDGGQGKSQEKAQSTKGKTQADSGTSEQVDKFAGKAVSSAPSKPNKPSPDGRSSSVSKAAQPQGSKVPVQKASTPSAASRDSRPQEKSQNTATSKNATTQQQANAGTSQPKKKPKKLEVRSSKPSAQAAS